MRLEEARLAHDADPGRFIPDDAKARLFAAFRKLGVRSPTPANYDRALRLMATGNYSPGAAARAAFYHDLTGVSL